MDGYLASMWKNLINSTIGDVKMLLSPSALKSLNSIKKFQLIMMHASFNGNLSTTIISSYSSNNASDKMDIITFYNELSSLVQHIPKCNILIIGGDMNIHVGKDGISKSTYTTCQIEMGNI